VARKQAQWDAASVRGLRRQLQLTQEQLAEALGVRQQTVSEWETGTHAPRGASGRMLSIVAERAEYRYQAGESPQGRDELKGARRPAKQRAGRDKREGAAGRDDGTRA
jgi:DNA-binding XRE family transcriptional regulator